jgi:hypothetical protein
MGAVVEYKSWTVDLVPEKYTVPHATIGRYGTRIQVQFLICTREQKCYERSKRLES